MQAARLLEKGYSQSEVARRVGVHRQSVSQWAYALQENGRAGLKKAGRAGRKPRLSADDLRQLERGFRASSATLSFQPRMIPDCRKAGVIVLMPDWKTTGPCSQATDSMSDGKTYLIPPPETGAQPKWSTQ